jgi:hypothetical protein
MLREKERPAQRERASDKERERDSARARSRGKRETEESNQKSLKRLEESSCVYMCVCMRKKQKT